MPVSQLEHRRSTVRRLALGLLTFVLLAGTLGAGAVSWFLSGEGIREALEQQASAWLGEPVRIEAVTARLLPRPGISLTNVRVGESGALILGRVAVSTDVLALLEQRIENAEIVVSASRIQMPLPFLRRAAAQEDDASAGSRVRLVSVRSIALDNITLVSGGREIVVGGESALDGDRLVIRRFAVRSGESALVAEGVVQLAPRADITVRARADVVDVDELLALADAFTPAGNSKGATAQSMRVAARISAERAVAGGVEVRQFAAELLADGDRVTLSPLTFQLFGGRYQGSLSAQLGDTIQVSLQSRVMDVDVAQLAAFGGTPGAVSGTLTGGGAFAGRGADLAAVLESARGEGTATVVNGAVQRLDLIRTVVLFFGRPAPETAAATDAFERMDVSFTLADQLVSARAFALRSRDADIVGSGTLNVESKVLTGQMDLSLSEELSAQAGSALQRYTVEGGRVVLPATIGGTLGGPRLRIDAAAAVKRGLGNEVRRRLGGLLGRLGGQD